jgi:hypothetical protein
MFVHPIKTTPKTSTNHLRRVTTTACTAVQQRVVGDDLGQKTVPIRPGTGCLGSCDDVMIRIFFVSTDIMGIMMGRYSVGESCIKNGLGCLDDPG